MSNEVEHPAARTWSRRTAGLVLALLIATAVTASLLATPDGAWSRVFHDEALFVQEARDFAAREVPLVNGVVRAKYPPLYPVLLAPLAAALEPPAFARWGRVLGALLAGLALVPAYRIARLSLTRGRAVLAAALALFAPGLVYTRYLLAENLALPLALASVWLGIRCALRPRAASGFAAGLACALAFLTKTHLVVLAPALVLTAAWVGRLGVERRAAWRAAFGFVAGALPLMAAWSLRGVFFPEALGLAGDGGYGSQFGAAGLQGLGHYALWSGRVAAIFLVVLGAPALLLGLARSLAEWRAREPERRAAGASTLFVLAGLWCVVVVWSAQVAPFSSKLHERYLVPLLPLLMIAAVAEVFDPRARRRQLAAAAALVALCFAGLPLGLLDGESQFLNPISFPSLQGLRELVAGTGGVAGWGALVFFQLVVLVPLARMRRPSRMAGEAAKWAALLLLACITLRQAHDVRVAFAEEHAYQVAKNDRTKLEFEWLDGLREPGDVLLFHGVHEDLAHHASIRFEQPVCIVRDGFGLPLDTPLAFDAATGTFALRGRTAGERLLLVTGSPGPRSDAELGRFGELRVLALDGGLLALGSWLGPPRGAALEEGFGPERRLAPGAHIVRPLAYPSLVAARIVLELEAGPGGARDVVFDTEPWGPVQLSLEPGVPFELAWSGPSWWPEVRFEVRSVPEGAGAPAVWLRALEFEVQETR